MGGCMNLMLRRRAMMASGQKEQPNYLCFTALESGTFTFTIGTNISTQFYSYVEYSADNCVTWVKTNNVNSTQIVVTTPTVAAGDKVYWRGSGVYVSNYFNNNRFSQFSSTGKFDASGNIASLCGLNNFDTWEVTATECQFAWLFSGTQVVDAGDLILPKFTKDRTYWHTFEGCVELITMPSIPNQDTIYSDSFNSTFLGCSKLTSVKPLPAMDLKNSCYSGMFKNCSSLVNAPELPATTLAPSCYYEMFSGTAIETAPLLNAVNINTSCYRAMFYNCSRLVNIQDELPATTLYERCYQSMFERCTSLTKVPRLPATTMATYCYYSMFNLTNLTGPFILPATNLAGTNQCYANMLRCKATYVKMLAVTLGTNSLNNWLNGVANVSTSIFVKHIDATWTDTGNSGVPSNWTIIYYDPAVDKYYTDQTRATECDDHGNPI